MARDPRKVAEKQIRNAQNNASSYVEGIDMVTEAPGLKASKKKEKYRNGVNAAIDKWAENTAAVSLEEWKKSAKEKGGRRFSEGVELAKDKILAFHEQFQTFVADVKRKLDEMPDATPEQREQKMLANVREMRKFKRSRRR